MGNVDMKAFFRTVAHLLGEGWHYNEIMGKKWGAGYESRFYVTNGRMSICFALPCNYKREPERFEVRGLVEQRTDKRTFSAGLINISRKKTVHQVARDIKNRLLPDLLKKHESVLSNEQEDIERQQNMQIRLDALRQVAPVQVYKNGGSYMYGVRMPDSNYVDFDMSQYSDWKVRAKIALPFDDFLQVLALIQKLETARAEKAKEAEPA